MKGLTLLICGCLIAWGTLLPAPAQTAPELREEGVLYFEGNLPEKIIATTRVLTTVYIGRDFQTALGNINGGQPMELIGMAPEGFIVKGTFRNNAITGWIRPEDLPTGIDPSLFAQAKKNQERHDAVAVAIANKSVIQGMTPDEVKESLGRPTKTASRTDAHGTTLSWTFITYREEPQYSYALDAYGRAFLQTYYVKIPIGRLTVDFVDNAVVAVAEQKTDPDDPGVVNN